MTTLSANQACRRFPMVLVLFVLALAAASSIGCGDVNSFSLAPVSGVVTLDGKPIPQAAIVFQPVGTAENPNPGPGSAAEADASGHFELKTIGAESQLGAVVGSHKVAITSHRPQQSSSNDSGFSAPKFVETVPARYNTESELTFEVPADGTTAADFKLTTQE